VDLSPHRPRPVRDELINEVDLVLTMTEHHKMRICERFPPARGKTEALLSFVGEQGDIDDPFGGSLEEYRECARRLWEAVNRIIVHLTPR